MKPCSCPLSMPIHGLGIAMLRLRLRSMPIHGADLALPTVLRLRPCPQRYDAVCCCPLCCILAASAAPQWARPRAPNQIDSHNGIASKLSLGAQKQKIDPCCNFFAITDYCGSP